MLTEDYGADLILDVWHRMGDSGGFTPFDAAFADRDTSFEQVMRAFAVKVLLRDFAEGDLYPVPRLDGEAIGPGEWSPQDGVQRYGMDYWSLNIGGGAHTVTINTDEPYLEGVAVGMRGSAADVFAPGGAVTINFDDYDRVYLIALNLNRPPNEAGCATARYTVTVQTAATEAAAPTYSLDAPHFVVPRLEAPTDPEDIPGLSPFYQTEFHLREEIREVDLPFDPALPKGVPRGYELDSVYGVQAEDLGDDFVTYNAPSGGIVAQILYFSDEGKVMRVTQSRSIYNTIGEWLAVNRLEFRPGTQVWTAGSVDTAIVELESGPLVVFIVSNRFMAIDGDADREAILDMARRYATSFRRSELPVPRIPLGGPFVAPKR
jgi:hypothetical protein